MESNQTIPINKDYKVLVGCMTYNHSKYIVDALNGFAMQKTNFPFACIVMDDASTDGEPEVIKDWLERECDMPRAVHYDLDLSNVIVVPHKTNENCTMAVYLLKRNLYTEVSLKFELAQPWSEHSEYIALCEGDDYWTDPEKLQIQSDCLDNQLEVDMCAHRITLKSAVTGKEYKHKKYHQKKILIPIEQIIIGGGGIIGTRSVFFRNTLASTKESFFNVYPIDYSLYILGALKGGITFINRNMAVYRFNVKNSWAQLHINDFSAHQQHICNQVKMLKALDQESSYKYHKSIEAGILLSEITYTNSEKRNLKILCSKFNAFWVLPFHQRIRIILLCSFPRLILYIKRAINV